MHNTNAFKVGLFGANLSLGVLSASVVQAPCGKGPGHALVPHANVHGCFKNATSWWCKQLVPAYQPQSVTTSPAQCSNATAQRFLLTVTDSTPVQPNEWVIYAHVYFWTQPALGAPLLAR